MKDVVYGYFVTFIDAKGNRRYVIDYTNKNSYHTTYNLQKGTIYPVLDDAQTICQLIHDNEGFYTQCNDLAIGQLTVFQTIIPTVNIARSIKNKLTDNIMLSQEERKYIINMLGIQ